MRTEREMLRLILECVNIYESIQIATLEGSRVNIHVKPDLWQDYDVSFFVPLKEMDFFRDETWLKYFGHCVFMQKPENMELFEPDFKEGWLSFLMLFDDGVRMDVKIIPLEDWEIYISQEPLVKVLCDKSCRIQQEILPSDRPFWIKPFTQRSFFDCSNEFYWMYANAYKAMLRGEALLMNAYLCDMRSLLLIVLSWRIGLKKGFEISLGKSYKFLPDHINKKTYRTILDTYRLKGCKQGYKVLKKMSDQFQIHMKKIARKASFKMPDDKKKVKQYCNVIKGFKSPTRGLK